MKYFVLAGEASGDKQGALLCNALREQDPLAIIRGWGGEDMQAAGASITKHYCELAYMGFIEVVRHLPAILQNFKTCKAEILDFKPDALILVDYPGFNLRMAGWAGHHDIPVYYYISPQLWAWHTSRVHKIKKSVRKMFVILPFEEAFYKKYGMEARYIGHPLAMEPDDAKAERESEKNIIALLPGSRKHEVEKLLPEMIALAAKMPEQSFVIGAVAHLPLSLYEEIAWKQTNVSIEVNAMKAILRRSEAAIVTSGTATLETALMGVPEIVVYKGSAVSYQIAKRLIKVPYISLVNLIMEQKLVPELIQSACNAENIFQALQEILQPERNAAIKAGYKILKSQLTFGGGAGAAAHDIISDLNPMKTGHGTVQS